MTAIVTDLTDGPLARRSGTASPFGGTFDHTTDFLFVVSGLAGGVVRGVIPWLLPVLVVAAFAQYVIDSYWLHRHHGAARQRLAATTASSIRAHLRRHAGSSRSPGLDRP